MKKHLTEWKLLLGACRSVLLKIDGYDFTSDIDLSKIDWPVFTQMARYHKVRPLLYKGIYQANSIDLFPEKMLNQLGLYAKSAVFRNLENARELLRLKPLLDEENIDIIPYKGTVLSQLAYGELGIRESSDIDILFNLSDYSKLKSLLIGQSYIEKFQLPDLLKAPAL